MCFNKNIYIISTKLQNICIFYKFPPRRWNLMKDKDFRRGKRIKSVFTKITDEDSKLLKEFGISISGAIEGYIDFCLTQYGMKEQELKKINKELQEIENMEKEKPKLLEQKQKLMDELNYINDNGLNLSPKQKGTIERLVLEFMKRKESFDGIEDYLEKQDSNIKMISFDKGIPLERFKKLIINEYKKQVEQLYEERDEKKRKILELIVLQDVVDDEVKVQIFHCIKRSVKLMNQNPNKFSTFEEYLEHKEIKRFIDGYCSKCGLEESKFKSYAIESFKKISSNKKNYLDIL